MASRRYSRAGGAAASAPLPGYRIVVVAASVGPLVEAAGGFLCDRIRAGWQVNVLCADAQTREALERFARRGCGAVTAWGRPADDEVDHSLEPDSHRLSRAAIAFKAHALRAARSSATVQPVEMLYRMRGEWYRRLHSV